MDRRYYSSREFRNILSNNGYSLIRTTGSHLIYSNGKSNIVITANNLNAMICRRLIKENELKLKW